MNNSFPAHHLMEGAPLTKWWGIYEQDESEQLKHIAPEVGQVEASHENSNRKSAGKFCYENSE